MAAAAYRAAEKLRDERMGRTWNYAKKQGVVFSQVMAPEHAPEWMTHRAKLWNHVENNERRKDAQVARDVTLSLPKGLSAEGQIEALRQFVKREFVDQGMVADVSLHHDNPGNPHAHILLTMRDVEGDGFGKKNRSWNHKARLIAWRQAWSESANRALVREGREPNFDHRSHAERGILFEPGVKLGVVGGRIDKDTRHIVEERLDTYLEIAKHNGEKIIATPELALSSLTEKRSTFSDEDLDRFLVSKTLDDDQFVRAKEAMLKSSELVSLGKNPYGSDLFTTKTVVKTEKRVLALGQSFYRRKEHEVDPAWVAQAEVNGRTLTEEQGRALHYLTIQSGDLALMEGYAGTGKSFVLRPAKEAWEAQGFRVLGAGLSGRAAEGLHESSGIPSRSLASWTSRWARGRDALRKGDVLVIDEAGMVGTKQLAEVFAYVEAAGAKVVLVGDRGQIPSIEAGAPFRKLADDLGYVGLENIYRQQVAWQNAATLDLAQGRTQKALQTYLDHKAVQGFEDQDAAHQKLVADWDADRTAHPNTSQLILAHRRDDVRALNLLARAKLRAEGALGEDVEVQTDRGVRCFSEGDRLYFLKNDNGLGVKNGTLGTIRAIDVEASKLVVELDDKGTDVVVDLTAYRSLEHGYAATLHKGQGVTVDRAYVLASAGFDQSLAYVALSRHKHDANLYWSKEVFEDASKMVAKLSRARTRAMALDHQEVDAPGLVDVLLALSAENPDFAAERLEDRAAKPLLSADKLLASDERFQQSATRLAAMEKTYRDVVAHRDVLERNASVATKGAALLGLGPLGWARRDEEKQKVALRFLRRSCRRSMLESRHRAESHARTHNLGVQRAQWALSEIQGLTTWQSTFTSEEAFRWLQGRGEGVGGESLEKAHKALLSLGGIQEVDPGVFTTASMLRTEESLKAKAASLSSRHTHKAEPSLVSSTDQALQEGVLFKEQAAALEYLTSTSGDLALLEGAAGTGKTHVLKAAKSVWEKQGFRVLGGGQTSRMARGFEKDTGISSRTLAGWSHAWLQGKEVLRASDVLIIDQAQSVGTKQLERILAKAEEVQAKVVLAGDVGQMPGIGAGAPFRLTTEFHKTAELQEEARRHEQAQHRQATQALAHDDVPFALQMYESLGVMRKHKSVEGAYRAAAQGWVGARQQNPKQTCLLLAHRKKDVEALNREARAIREEAGELGHGCKLLTDAGPRVFAKGDRVVFSKNDARLGITNGMVGTIRVVSQGRMGVQLDENKDFIILDPREYRHFDYGYASTLSQGGGETADKTVLFVSPSMDKASVTTALTRHKKDIEVHWSTQHFKDFSGLRDRVSMERSKQMALDVAQKRARDEQRVTLMLKTMAMEKDAKREPRTAKEIFHAYPEVAKAKLDVEIAQDWFESKREARIAFAQEHPIKARFAQKGVGPQASFYKNEEQARAKLIQAKKAFRRVVSSQDRQRKAMEDAKADKALVMKAREELPGVKKAYEALLEQKRLEKARDRARKGYGRSGGLEI